MANTFELIASSTVGSSGAASISFTSIPSTYTDLKLVLSGRNTSTSSGESYFKLQMNSVSANYSRRNLYEAGAVVYSGAASGETQWNYLSIVGGGSTANTFSNGELYIPNYAGSNAKSVSYDSVTENNATQQQNEMNALLNTSTAAITSLTLTPHDNSPSTLLNFVQYSTAYLYGIKNS